MTIKELKELAELGLVEKLPPRPGEIEPRWRLTELGKSQGGEDTAAICQ